MASIRKVRDKWQAEVRLKGRYRSKVFITKREATQWALEQETAMGRFGDRLPSHTVGQAMQRFADEVSPLRKGARWEIVRLKKLQRDKLSSIVLESLRQEDLQDWINRQTNAAGSIRRELDLIQSVLKEARLRWKWMHENVTKDLRKPPPPKHRDRRISEAEIAAILLELRYCEGHPPRLGK